MTDKRHMIGVDDSVSFTSDQQQAVQSNNINNTVEESKNQEVVMNANQLINPDAKLDDALVNILSAESGFYIHDTDRQQHAT